MIKWHNFQSNEYKAAAYSNELVKKSESMINQLKKVDPQLAMGLSTLVKDFNNYVRKNIYKEKNVEEPKFINMMLQQQQEQQMMQQQQMMQNQQYNPNYLT